MTKEEFKKEYKPIYRAYSKELKKCHEFNIKNLFNPMSYFITYLFFMRDFYLLSTPSSDNSEATDTKISALMMACELGKRLESYQTELKANLSEDEYVELKKEYILASQKFWQLVAVNMEDWLPYDA